MARPPGADSSPTPSTSPLTCAADGAATSSRFPAGRPGLLVDRGQRGCSRPREPDPAIGPRRTADRPATRRQLERGVSSPPPPGADLSWQGPPDRGVVLQPLQEAAVPVHQARVVGVVRMRKDQHHPPAAPEMIRLLDPDRLVRVLEDGE